MIISNGAEIKRTINNERAGKKTKRTLGEKFGVDNFLSLLSSSYENILFAYLRNFVEHFRRTMERGEKGRQTTNAWMSGLSLSLRKAFMFICLSPFLCSRHSFLLLLFLLLLMRENAFIIYHISLRDGVYQCHQRSIGTHFCLVCIEIMGFQLALLSHFIQMAFGEWCSNCCSLVARLVLFEKGDKSVGVTAKYYLNRALSAECTACLCFIILEKKYIRENWDRERERERGKEITEWKLAS